MDWLTEYKLPLGKWIKVWVDLLNEHAAGVFDWVSLILGSGIEGVMSLMLACPPLVFIACFAVLAWWLHRSLKLIAMIIGSFLLIINLGYWQSTIESLALVMISTLICLVVGVPLGIAAAHRPWLYRMLRPILDLMQTVPTFVYLIPALILFG